MLPFLQLKLVVGEVVLHGGDEVFQNGVLPLELVEVFRQSLREVLLSDDEHQLLHCGGALAVRNAVKDRLSDVSVRYGTADGVGCYHLVLCVSPALAVAETGHTGVVFQSGDVRLDFLEAEVADEVSEALVEPEIVPPLHSNEVSEPVMSQFVGDSVGETQHSLVRDLFFPDVKIVEGDDTGVLHGTPFVLMDEHLLVLVEGVWVAKVFLVELHGLDRNLPDEGSQGLQVLDERLDAVQGHRNVLVGVGTHQLGILTCHEAEQVVREDFGLGVKRHLLSFGALDELSHGSSIGSLHILDEVLGGECALEGRLFVGEYLPLVGSNDIQDHACLEVWLVEQRQHPVAVVRLELGIDVLLPIDIDEADTAVTIVVVVGAPVYDGCVDSQHEIFFGQLDKATVVINLVELLAVDGEAEYLLSSIVEEEVVVDIFEREGGFSDAFVAVALVELQMESVLQRALCELRKALLGCFVGEWLDHPVFDILKNIQI